MHDAILKDQNINYLMIDTTYCNKNHEKQNAKGNCCKSLLSNSNTKENSLNNSVSKIPVKIIPDQGNNDNLRYSNHF